MYGSFALLYWYTVSSCCQWLTEHICSNFRSVEAIKDPYAGKHHPPWESLLRRAALGQWRSFPEPSQPWIHNTIYYLLCTYGRSKQCNRYEHCRRSCNQLSPQDLLNVTAHTMTSYGHVTSSMTSPIECPWPLFYRLPIEKNPLSTTVSKILCYRSPRSPTFSNY